MEFEIPGLSGKITIKSDRVGINHRIVLYNNSNNSVYFVLGSEEDVNKWIDLFSFPTNGMCDKIYVDRAVLEVMRIGDLFIVEAYGIESPGSKNKAIFSISQAMKIVESLK